MCVEGRTTLNKLFVSAKLTCLVQTDSDTPVCRWRSKPLNMFPRDKLILLVKVYDGFLEEMASPWIEE